MLGKDIEPRNSLEYQLGEIEARTKAGRVVIKLGIEEAQRAIEKGDHNKAIIIQQFATKASLHIAVQRQEPQKEESDTSN